MMTHYHRLLLLKHKEDKTHKKITTKKTKRREGAYLQAPTPPSHFWLSLLPFCFKQFLLASSSSSQAKKKKRNKQRNKNHRKEKKCRDGRELSFKLLLCPLTFGFLPSCFYPSVSNAFS
jgi:hypothetical protein